MNTWRPFEGHPISLAKARALLAGDLGDVYRSILMASCAPIFWYRPHRKLQILHNGTVTFLRTPERLLGVTAAHVLHRYIADAALEKLRVQIDDAVLDDLRERIISLPRPGQIDIATFSVDDLLLKSFSKKIVPLGSWPPRAPCTSGRSRHNARWLSGCRKVN